jgi:hypothetical protein
VSGQLHVPIASHPPLHIVEEAGWAPEPVWQLWREENLFSLPGIEPQFLGHPAHSLVAIPTELLGSLIK